MKRFYLLLLALISLLPCSDAIAQTTINTTIGSTGYTGTNNSGSGSWITFIVENHSGAGILLTDVGNWTNSGHNGSTSELWYSTTSLSGPVNALTGPTWSLVASSTPTGLGATLQVNNVISNMTFLIPNGAQYRFALYTSGTNYYSGTGVGTASPNTFTTNGVSLITGDYQISSQYVGYGYTNNPRFFTGSITYVVAGPPCPAPSNLLANNVLSTSADLSWDPVAGSVGYEYFIDQNAAITFPYTATTITGTSVSATGLATSTNYYLHVRNKCSANNPSAWVHLPFTTLPPCKPPVGFNVTNLEPTSATINWNLWLSAQTYDYLVDQTRADPVSSTGILNTAMTSIPLTGLTENTWYYVHTRSRCAGNELSDWGLDSFLTPIVCRAPQILIEHINTDEGVAFWEPVNTAYQYEYAITNSATPPAVGTKYNQTSLHTSALDDGADYYVHVRCHCESVGIFSTSPWATTSFKTFAVGINTLNAEKMNMTVYPNPVSEKMHVELSHTNTNATLSLLDMTGKLLFIVPVNKGVTEIDMTGILPGMYLLKYSDDTNVKTVRISKQ